MTGDPVAVAYGGKQYWCPNSIRARLEMSVVLHRKSTIGPGLHVDTLPSPLQMAGVPRPLEGVVVEVLARVGPGHSAVLPYSLRRPASVELPLLVLPSAGARGGAQG